MMLYAVGVVGPGFYAGSVGLAPAAIGLVLLVTRLGDVVFDFGAGALSDMTPGPFGRRKPWLALGAVVVAAAFALQLTPPAGAGVAWFFWTSIGFYLGWSLFAVPFDAWGSELAGDYDARSRLFAWRAGAGYVGSLLFSVLPALPIFGATDFSPRVLRFAAVAVAAMLAVCAPLAILGAPREPPSPRRSFGFGGVLRAARFNRPLRLYVAAATLSGLSDGLFTAVVFIYQALYMGFASRMWLILVVYIGSNFLTLPLWTAVALRIGKHRAWAWGLGLTALCYPPMALLPPGPSSFPVMITLVALAGGTYSIANVAMPAVLGDVSDYETLKSGAGKTGSLFAIQALLQKFNVAVGTGLAFLLIGAFGYHAGPGPMAPRAVLGLQLAHLYLPSALKLVAIGLIWRFPLDGRVQAIVRRRLDQRATRQGRETGGPNRSMILAAKETP
jgi:Na+/melibiose symporter-like transporter